MRLRLSIKMKFLMITLVISTILVSIGILSKDLGVIGNAIILSTFIIASPQLFLAYQKYRELKEMEEKFPLFLRDLIESLRSGMSFHKAITTASKLDYGKLSKEIRKMGNQISWGMTLDKVLDQFADRIKKSKRLYTSIKIIREAYLSGGEVISTLESVADSDTLLEDSEKERKSLLDQYVVMMYAISMIFIVIVTAINRLLIPIFQVSTTAFVGEGIGLANPCANTEHFVCALFSYTAKFVFALQPSAIASYYTSLFFWMALIQSIFSGLVAGQISESSIVAGAKHSLILAGITIGAFYILIRLGLLGV